MKNSEEGAFPKPDNDNYLDQNGLTKREYFAGLAMQSMVASGYYGGTSQIQEAAKQAIKLADELLKQLES
jgi:hypothetical protein